MKQMQKDIYQNKINKGFNIKDVNAEFCLIYGEVSEAYEAWKKKSGTVGENLLMLLYTLWACQKY